MMSRSTNTIILAMLIAVSITVTGCGGGGAASAPAGSGVTVVTLATQTTGFLSDPRALAISPKDGKLYVADNEASGFCIPSCIRTVDPVSGVVGTTAVVASAGGIIEGVSFDATGDNLYYTERQTRIGRLTWNGSSYASPFICNNVGSGNPQDPYRIVVDASLGRLVADDNTGSVMRNDACDGTNAPTTLSITTISQPRGIALGPTGNILVSSITASSIYSVDRASRAVTPYHGTGLNQPMGIAWLGGSSTWANSVLVADFGSSSIIAANGSSARIITTLASPPVDLSLASSSLYVLSKPSGSAPGRIYKITGF